jgi:hypothetical protein
MSEAAPQSDPRQSPPGRKNVGRPFVKGDPSPNPGGRPPIPVVIKTAAREHTIEALTLLVSMARDPKVSADIRRRCCNDLLDRAWGKTPIMVTQKGTPPAAPSGPLVNFNMFGAQQPGHSGLAPDQSYAFMRDGLLPIDLSAFPQKEPAIEAPPAKPVEPAPVSMPEAIAPPAIPTPTPQPIREPESSTVVTEPSADSQVAEPVYRPPTAAEIATQRRAENEARVEVENARARIALAQRAEQMPEDEL